MNSDCIGNLVKQVKVDLLIAECKFNQATTKTEIDIATMEMKSAEQRLNDLYKKAKEVGRNESM